MKPAIAAFATLWVAFIPACTQQNGPEAQIDRAPVHDARADEAAQTRQLLELAKDPKAISDKLFILWEYGGALRERDLAKAVLKRSSDPEIRSLAIIVRDGHQAGMDIMVPIARELGLALPAGPTAAELAAIEAASALPAAELEQFFLLRQRAMHAWDITVFDAYGPVARSEQLKRYVADVRAPLRDHAETVVRLANKRGVAGGLTVVEAQESAPGRP